MNLKKAKQFLCSKIGILIIISFIWVVADTMLEFVFPTYLESINKSYMEIGFLLSLASIAGLSIDLPVGSLSDRASRKKIMISGLALSIVAAALLFSFRRNIILAWIFLF